MSSVVATVRSKTLYGLRAYTARIHHYWSALGLHPDVCQCGLRSPRASLRSTLGFAHPFA
ncbi:hypothetical protein PENSPDRAFT_655148 [Peniophora sp. CONT]|nr:hypothetical protein PENSPDRAFT_655148 [Peniophora sp. CONT]